MTGGNIDSTVLGRTIERGLAVDGRLVKFDIVVSDRPGGMKYVYNCRFTYFRTFTVTLLSGIAELTNVIAQSGASIKDIFHERAWLAANVFEVRVRVVIETRERSHAQELHDILRKKYTHVSFPLFYNNKLLLLPSK